MDTFFAHLFEQFCDYEHYNLKSYLAINLIYKSHSYLIMFDSISSCWRDLVKVWAFWGLESFSVSSLSYLADLILLAKEISYQAFTDAENLCEPKKYYVSCFDKSIVWIQLVWPSDHFMSSIETLKSDDLTVTFFLNVLKVVFEVKLFHYFMPHPFTHGPIYFWAGVTRDVTELSR